MYTDYANYREQLGSYDFKLEWDGQRIVSSNFFASIMLFYF
jgi:hypothetical protein